MGIDGRTDLKHLSRESWQYQTLLFQACRRREGTWLRVDRVGGGGVEVGLRTFVFFLT